jgi:Leucine-rich repeat (LRR) protein
MRKNSLNIFSFIFFTFLTVTSFSQNYTLDSLAVRAILDTNGLDSITVSSVSDSSEGRIVVLNISKKGLTCIPDKIQFLDHLITLSLEVNDIDSLPPHIGGLYKLEELVIYTNNLTRLPFEIGNLTNLKTLKISSNKLTTLPASIGRCSGITTLRAYRNNISSLPDSIILLFPWIECDFGYNHLDSTKLQGHIVAWLNSFDPNWNTTQIIVPIINSSDYTPESQQYYILPSIRNSLITYYLPSSGNIRLEVLDLKGRLVSTLVDAYRRAGNYSVNWNAGNYSSGIYHFQLRSENCYVIKKAAVVK